ncbi:MAG: Gldg family protein, partial [Planctomycetota bacterium]
GAAFNAPLAFAASADAIIPQEVVSRFVKSLSIAEQFRDFGRGVVSLPSVVFFASIAVVMLYLCMVLIGRRHWGGHRGGPPMAAHYTLRVLALAAIAVGVNMVAQRAHLQFDISSERLSSLSDQTRELLRRIDSERPVYVEAYVSPEVPQQYAATRLNLVSMLREMDRLGGDRVIVRINDTQRHSREAAEAEQQFGIPPRTVPAMTGGKLAVEEIFLGVAFMCGIDKVVAPFFDLGIPVEYEFVRSIETVSQQERRTVGVVMTDARLYGGFDIQTMSSRPNQQIINELQKQYEVSQVDLTTPISEPYDVLLAVQPSSLPQPQLDNLVAAIRNGQPTAIFEDPFPFVNGDVPGTSQPRRPPGGNNPFMQQRPPPEPKGDINQLWSLLGVQFTDREIVWDRYNPYPQLTQFNAYPEFVFVSAGAGGPEPFSQQSGITRGLQQVLLVFPGAIQAQMGSTLAIVPLLRAGQQTGVVAHGEILQRSFLGPTGINPNRRLRSTRESYVLAARITGPAPSASDESTEPGADLNVALVADIDVLHSAFFAIRARGEQEQGPSISLDNVTFVLNVLDQLAGDERFLEIRKRRRVHRTLTAVENHTEQARDHAIEERERFLKEFDASRAQAQQELQDKINELQAREGIDPQQMLLEVAMKQNVEQSRLDAKLDRLERDRDRQLAKIERELALEIRQVEKNYKLAAVALPPIPPLFVGVLIFFRRRSLERIGVPKARLR